jgi:4-hydroxythreonine-4-phosphate dehydrogenase
MQKQRESFKDKKPILGITHGDYNGVGYEVIIKALNDKRILDFFTPVIYGLSRVLSYNRKMLNLPDFSYQIINDADQAANQKINILNLSNEEVKIEYGKSTHEAGAAAFDALEQAVTDIRDGKIDMIITAPVNKQNIQSDQFNFPGHTEYFTQRFDSKTSLMLLVKDNLRIGVVTGHIPLKDVALKLNEIAIIEKIEILDNSLKRDFGITKPKIALLGLNPHAGDHGLIGKEDDEIIKPAILKAKESGKLIYGPFPADGFFGSDDYTKYDAILAMYHDQGLIPFKTLAFENGVNFTAGLPIVRTSPAHGTAYEIAGNNVASFASMRQAMYLAADIFKNRMAFDEMTSNPLPSGLINEAAQTKNAADPEEFKDVQD